jgi:hypothetical protein
MNTFPAPDPIHAAPDPIQAAARERRDQLKTVQRSFQRLSLWQIAGLASAALILISAFLPWASLRAMFVGQASVHGNDAPLAVGVAIFVAVAFFLRKRILSIVAASVAVLFALIEFGSVEHGVTKINNAYAPAAAASVGFGIWVMMLGVAGALTAAIIEYRSR